MNYRNPLLLDELAAQYVLGTLRGRARRRFERLCKQLPIALNAVQRWEDRLQGLVTEFDPVKPPAIVWQKIRERIGRKSTEQRNGFFSWLNRTQLAFAAGITAIALSVTVWTLVNNAALHTVATFADQQHAEQWRVEADNQRTKFRVTRSIAFALDESRDYELWALPDSGAPPVSLGLMPKSGNRNLQLSAAQRLALSGASKIAISLEPRGGSPTGAPTGPVLFVTTIALSG